MKIYIIALLSPLIFLANSFANDCIANPPIASVRSDAPEISKYQKIEDTEKQVITEIFQH